mmetsp:Transcript_968/g.2288  ORF Transcript_968/g.2288 Transcript_968/m.2288 type:complete len:257 (+) Transcript_968:138-908(+)
MQSNGDHAGSASADQINGSGTNIVSQLSADDNRETVDTLFVSAWRSTPDPQSITEEDSEDSVGELSRETSAASNFSGKGKTGPMVNGALGTVHERLQERRPSDVSRLSSTDFNEDSDKVMELISTAAEARPQSPKQRKPEHRIEHAQSHGDLRHMETPSRTPSREPMSTHSRSLSPVARRPSAPVDRSSFQKSDDEDADEKDKEDDDAPAPPRKPHNWKPHPWSLSWRQQHAGVEGRAAAVDGEEQLVGEREGGGG